MKKTKRNKLNDLQLNMLNEQYKNSKVFFVNKGINPNITFNNESNIISFDTRQLNKTQYNGSLTNRSQNDSSLNLTGNDKVFNYKEREIDNKIKKIMISKKRVSPYLNNNC